MSYKNLSKGYIVYYTFTSIKEIPQEDGTIIEQQLLHHAQSPIIRYRTDVVRKISALKADENHHSFYVMEVMHEPTLENETITEA